TTRQHKTGLCAGLFLWHRWCGVSEEKTMSFINSLKRSANQVGKSPSKLYSEKNTPRLMRCKGTVKHASKKAGQASNGLTFKEMYFISRPK
ncbi:MAG: hypothetical protein L7U52_06840, partial [Alphaproteobacteria bacterium]|nr:hypothetical protein [Alphaproteobacteria bacterium]